MCVLICNEDVMGVKGERRSKKKPDGRNKGVEGRNRNMAVEKKG